MKPIHINYWIATIIIIIISYDIYQLVYQEEALSQYLQRKEII